jgi:hypothetical protein
LAAGDALIRKQRDTAEVNFAQLAMSQQSVEDQLGVPLAGLDAGGLRGIVDRRVCESDQIDFKSALPSDRDLATDVVSFANHLGGLIVVGIDEREADGSKKTGAAVRLTPIPERKGRELIADWATSAIANYVVPRIDLAITWIPSGEGAEDGFLAIGIPRSSSAPHAVKEGDGRFLFKRRRGTSNGELTEAEIAIAYSERGKEKAKRAALLIERSLVSKPLPERYETKHEMRPHLNLWLTLIPDVEGNMAFDASTPDEIEIWARRYQSRDVGVFRGPSFPSRTRSVVQRRAIQLLDEQKGKETWLHQDGSVSLSWTVDHSGASTVVDEQEMLGAVVAALRFSADHAVRAGSFGYATAEIAVAATNGSLSVIGTGRLDRFSKSTIGDGTLPLMANPVTLVVDLNAIATKERAAAHTAWFYLDELFQENLHAYCQVMRTDGTFDFTKMYYPGRLRELKLSDGLVEFQSLNDRTYATGQIEEDGRWNLRIGSSAWMHGDFEQSRQAAQTRFESDRWHDTDL